MKSKSAISATLALMILLTFSTPGIPQNQTASLDSARAKITLVKWRAELIARDLMRLDQCDSLAVIRQQKIDSLEELLRIEKKMNQDYASLVDGMGTQLINSSKSDSLLRADQKALITANKKLKKKPILPWVLFALMAGLEAVTLTAK